MSKVVEYRIVSCFDTSELEEFVNQWIKDGWQPFGPPFTGYSTSPPSKVAWQAMVRYEQPAPRKVGPVRSHARCCGA